MTTHHLTFAAERETAGAVRYEEIEPDGAPTPKGEFVIGKVYLRKDAFDGPMPTRITMTIEGTRD